METSSEPLGGSEVGEGEYHMRGEDLPHHGHEDLRRLGKGDTAGKEHEGNKTSNVGSGSGTRTGGERS